MQTPSESDNLATARRYLEALERGGTRRATSRSSPTTWCRRSSPTG